MVFVLLCSPLNSLLEILLGVLPDEVNLVPHLDVLVFEHVSGQADFFDDFQHGLLLEVCLRMTYVPDMNY